MYSKQVSNADVECVRPEVNNATVIDGFCGEGPSRRVALAALASSLLVTACHRPTPLSLGFVAGLSGTAADLGSGVYNGVQLAVEEINAAGGLHGRPVELLVRDDRGNADDVRRHVVDLVQRGIEIAIGPVTSSMALAALDEAAKHGLVLFSPTATSDELSGRDDNFFRITPPLSRLAAQHAAFIYRQGARRLSLAIGTGNAGYTTNYERVVRQSFTEMGGVVSDSRSFGAGVDGSYRDVAGQVLADVPDAIMTIASAQDTALFMLQLRRGKPPRWLASAHWGDTPSLLKAGGQAVEGIIVTQYFDPQARQPPYLDFAGRYQRRFGDEAGFAGIYGYDAGRFVLAAMTARQPGQPIKQALLQLGTVPGLQGPLTIDRFGDGSRTVGLAVVQRGHLVALTP